MNILIISPNRALAGLTQTLASEGHEVALYHSGSDVGRPFRSVGSWRENYKQADLVVCDQALVRSVYGALERAQVPQLNASLGWQSTLGDPDLMGEIGEMLNQNPQGNHIEPGMYPLSVVGMWNGTEFLYPYFLAFEESTWGPGSYGDVRLYGPTGSAVFARAPKDRLFIGSLGRLSEALSHTNYRGLVQLSGFVYQEKLVWTRVTSPCSDTTMDAILALSKGPVAGLLNSLAQGTLRSWPYHSGCASVCFCVYSSMNLAFSLMEEQERHVRLYDVLSHEGMYVSRPDGDGHLAHVTARGDTLTQALGRAHRTIDNTFPHTIKFKFDLGRRVLRPYDTLKHFVYNTQKIGGGLWSHLKEYDWIN